VAAARYRSRIVAVANTKDIMQKNLFGRGSVFLLMILLAQFVLFAGAPEQIASKTGLDQDLFSTLNLEVNGTQLSVFVVAVTDRAFNSRVSEQLLATLRPYVGRNALYVNPTVEEVMPSFPFNPAGFKVSQDGAPDFVPTANDWVEISEGFLSGRFVMNPGGEAYGSGSEGLLLMDGHIDIMRPFTISYGGQSATFSVHSYATSAPSTTSGTASSPAQSSVVVPIPPQVTDLQDALTTGEFTAESMASLFSLPPALVRTLDITMRTSELRLLFVLLSEDVRSGSFSDDLLTSIEPLIGTGAMMVWALSATGSPFTSWSFFVQQNGTNYVFFSDASFVELTPGFLRSVEVPAGQLLAGVIRLPKGIDLAQPFAVFYGTNSAAFDAQ